jgi:hypothetical protein
MLLLKLCQLQAKYEMSQKLKLQQNTERIVLHKNFFKQRLKTGSEIDWDNKRFDVVRASYATDSVYIDAINDVKEKGILQCIGKFMHQQNKENQDPLKLSTLGLLIFQATLPEKITLVVPISNISNAYCDITFCINKIDMQLASPPPRF